MIKKLKKYTGVLALSVVMTIGSLSNVMAANYCAGSTIFQNNKTTVLGTTYCSYATSDHELCVTFSAVRNSDGKVIKGGSSRSGVKTVQASKSTNSTWRTATGEHKVYYRGTLSWEYVSHA